MLNSLLIAALIASPIAAGLLLRWLSRKKDYVADRRDRQNALDARLRKAQCALGLQPPKGVEPLLNFAAHFLKMADTALVMENVQRADVHQKLAATILTTAEQLQDRKFTTDWWLDQCLFALANMKAMKPAAAMRELNVKFEIDPPLEIRQLGLSCLIWVQRTCGNHADADTCEYELGLLPGKYAAANLD